MLDGMAQLRKSNWSDRNKLLGWGGEEGIEKLIVFFMA